ncbi:hypothetical protein G4B88_008055 [Cannabis sativa]|uniref:No apical meristem-associated C-terminal domain-containing protein n=1 Tax=Cannabis sativa TaxID=3483 RepID=A0A7J6I8S4_CANSA|nr:hypothetical protein G4B88_008055 [Cannabis sativa]
MLSWELTKLLQIFEVGSQITSTPTTKMINEELESNAKTIETRSKGDTFQWVLQANCWRMLKDEPKWNAMYQSEGVKRAKVPRSGAYTSSYNADINDHEVREERPIGQKAAKRKGKLDEQLATYNDINQQKANALEKLVAVQ